MSPVQRVDLAVTQYLQATEMVKLNVIVRTVSVRIKNFNRVIWSPGSRIRLPGFIYSFSHLPVV